MQSAPGEPTHPTCSVWPTLWLLSVQNTLLPKICLCWLVFQTLMCKSEVLLQKTPDFRGNEMESILRFNFIFIATVNGSMMMCLNNVSSSNIILDKDCAIVYLCGSRHWIWGCILVRKKHLLLGKTEHYLLYKHSENAHSFWKNHKQVDNFQTAIF